MLNLLLKYGQAHVVGKHVLISSLYHQIIIVTYCTAFALDVLV